MKVLVTGGAGFIGGHICEALLARGHTVLVIDDLSRGRRENMPEGVIFWCGSITDPRFIEYALRSFTPDVICHEAAQPSLLTSVERPELDAQINVIGTINVIQSARRVGARVIFASTSAVYDDAAPKPFSENSPLRPTRPYGISKQSAEMYLQESGLSYAILRYGNVYGPRQVPVGENQLVPHALDHILEGAPFVVNGSGEQSRDFIFVGDVARANVAAIESAASGTFNIATGKGTSVNSVLEELKSICKFKGEWEYGPAKEKEPLAVALDSGMAKEVLGWQAETSLAEGLKLTAEWRMRGA